MSIVARFFGVIDRLAKRDFPTPFVALRGNHEDAMCDFSLMRRLRWLDGFGGLDTLRSYGVDVRRRSVRAAWRACAELVERTPQEHRRFLDETRFSANMAIISLPRRRAAASAAGRRIRII
jgi:serine/threonine protein phosphatase 1